MLSPVLRAHGGLQLCCCVAETVGTSCWEQHIGSSAVLKCNEAADEGSALAQLKQSSMPNRTILSATSYLTHRARVIFADQFELTERLTSHPVQGMQAAQLHDANLQQKPLAVPPRAPGLALFSLPGPRSH